MYYNKLTTNLCQTELLYKSERGLPKKKFELMLLSLISIPSFKDE